MLKKIGYVIALLLGFFLIVWLAIYCNIALILLEPFERTWLPKRFQQIALKVRKSFLIGSIWGNGRKMFQFTTNTIPINILDLSQYLGHILVETAKTFSLFLNLQTPVELSNESNYGFDYDYKILQCS